MKYIGYFLTLLIGFCAGTIFGFKQGPIEYLYWNSQFEASLLAGDIQKLKSGNIKHLIDFKESFLNQELANHGKYLESKLAWLSFYNYDDGGRAIKHAVDYRLANPFTDIDMSKPNAWAPNVDMNSDQVKDVVQWQKDQERLIKKVLDLYSSNE